MTKSEEELKKLVLSIPVKAPERESDEYDAGRRDMRDEVLALL